MNFVDVISRPRRGSGADRTKAPPITTSTAIDLEDAYHGTEREVAISREQPCETCAGRGSHGDRSTCQRCAGRGAIVHIRDTMRGRSRRRESCPQCDGRGTVPTDECSTCEGTGYVTEPATVTVDVPVGVETGDRIRLAGAGNRWRPDQRAGDVLIDVTVSEHPRIEREGADLYRIEPVSFPTATLGGTIPLSQFDETIDLTTPPGTQHGETFRLAGKGMPDETASTRGDLFVTLPVVVPDDLSDSEHQRLRAYDRLRGESESA